MWQGNRTFLRNFAEFPKVFRRDAGKVLQYLSKEFATPAEIAGDKAIFVGKRGPQDFELLLQRYVKDYLECPTCKIPDTKIEKVNRLGPVPLRPGADIGRREGRRPSRASV